MSLLCNIVLLKRLNFFPSTLSCHKGKEMKRKCERNLTYQVERRFEVDVINKNTNTYTIYIS